MAGQWSGSNRPYLADFAPRHFLNRERLDNEYRERYEAAVADPDPRGYTVTFPESFRYAGHVSGVDETCGHVHATVEGAVECQGRLNAADKFGGWEPCPARLRPLLEERP